MSSTDFSSPRSSFFQHSVAHFSLDTQEQQKADENSNVQVLQMPEAETEPELPRLTSANVNSRFIPPELLLRVPQPAEAFARNDLPQPLVVAEAQQESAVVVHPGFPDVPLDARAPFFGHATGPANKAAIEPPAMHPPSAFAARVDGIMRNCVEQSVRTAETLIGDAVPSRNFYPLWGMLLSLGGPLAQIDIGKQSAALGSMPFAFGQGRILDGLLTKEGFAAASERCKKDWVDGCNHLNTLLGLDALHALDKENEAQPDGAQKAETRALIQTRRQELEERASRSGKAFHAAVSKERVVTRNALGFVRDGAGMTLGSANSAYSMSINSVKAAAHGVLGSGAQTAAAVGSGFSAGLGTISGGFNFVQGIWELVDGGRDKSALSAAESLDKDVFARYGSKEFPELEQLIWLRHDLRELERSQANLLMWNGAFRGGYGLVGLASASVSIALLAGVALSAGATMGATVIMGAVAVGLYMLWINARATMVLNAHKRYNKALQAIEGNTHVTAAQLPGLAVEGRRLSPQEIVDRFMDKLANEATRDLAKTILLNLNVPLGAIDAAIRGNRVWLEKSLLPERGMSVTQADALRNMYANPKATAREKLRVVQHWLAHPELEDVMLLVAKREAPPSSWSQYLASGKSMKDVCQSTLTEALIKKHWNDEGLQALLQESLRGPGSEPFKDPRAAWQALQEKRTSQKLSSKAEVTVAGWIAGAKIDAIKRCLTAGKGDALTLACLHVLQSTYSFTAEGDIRAELCAWVLRQPLHIDNIALYMAACKASPSPDTRKAFVEKIEAFVETCKGSLPLEEQGAFVSALYQGDMHSLHGGNVDAVLARIQKFLLVSKKLREQTLTKVVASLYEYPTDGSIPKGLARAAAMRELHLRVAQAPESQAVSIRHAFSLARQLAGEKLHKRTWGAGEGGGVAGFFGYELNEKGKLLRQVFEKCMEPGESQEPVSKDGSIQQVPVGDTSQQSTRASEDAVRGEHEHAALDHWMRKLTKRKVAPGSLSMQKLVDESAMHRDPKKLKEALKSGKGDRLEAAKWCLDTQLTDVKENLEAAAKNLDGARFVEHLQTLSRLYGLAFSTRRKVSITLENVDIRIANRMQFYLAALQWKTSLDLFRYRDRTAVKKNVQAIREDFRLMKAEQPPTADELRSGKLPPAHDLWSDRFLQTRKNEYGLVLKALKNEYPWLNTEGLSYKDAVKAMRALADMKEADVLKAVKRGDVQAERWLWLQFHSAGREMPVGYLKSLRSRLHKAYPLTVPQAKNGSFKSWKWMYLAKALAEDMGQGRCPSP